MMVYRGILRYWVIICFLALSIPLLGQDQEEESAINAIKTGDIEVLKAYLEKHPDFIESDNSTLNLAIRYNQGRIARLLIEYGADVNKEDKKLNTPLIYAAGYNNLEICKILVDRGADPLHENKGGKRASDYAFFFDESPAYKYLKSMEKFCSDNDTVPSMHDGPYIYLEGGGQVIMTYYERDHDKNLTRLIEKTIDVGQADTIVEGIGWDKNSYYITQNFTPDPFEITATGNIFAVGDIHGKYNALVNLLVNNKIIGPDLKWIFGEGQLVLLGDVFDRGASVLEVLWFIYELDIQARNSGGKVHLLLGNHEIMALTGDHRYVHDKYNYFTQYTRVDYYQLFEKNTVLGKWLRNQNLIIRINDNLFLHAGISPQFAAYGYSYADINLRVQNYLNSGLRDEDGSPEDNILGPVGPLWYRGYFNTDNNISKSYSSNSTEVTQQFVDDYLSAQGLQRMIIGHNEQDTINVSYEGKIISADVAIDESGKTSQGLLISGDKIFRCFSDGRKEPIE
jgi:hypothetical protein